MNDKGENELLDVTTPPEERVILPKKRFGFWGKFVAFLLGFIIGIGSLCGTVFYVAGNVKIKKLTNFVGEFAGFDYQTFVEKDYVSEALGDETMMQAIANLGYTAKQKKLAPFCYYFPKLQDVIDDFVQDLNKEFGIEAVTSEVLETPVTEIPTYLSDKISTAELGKIMKATSPTGKLDDLMMELCYGQEGKDYEIIDEETGEIKMINGSKPTTVGDMSGDTKGVLNNVMLSHVIKEKRDNKIIMYLLYGKEGVEYYIDENNEIQPLQMQIAVKDGKVYDFYGDEMLGEYSWNEEKGLFIDEKGNKHYLDGRVKNEANEDATVEVAEGVFADLYYVKDENGEDIMYHPTTVGEMSEERCHLTTLTERMTVGELMNGNKEDPNDKVYGNKILKHLADSTIETMPDQIKTLSFGQVFEEDIYNETTHEMKGVWKYMLKDQATVDENDNPLTEEQRIEKGLKYSITEDMSKIMDNMTANMKNAKLVDLDNDQIISMENLDTKLAAPLKEALSPTMKAELGLDTDPNKEITVGSLTVNQMLNVMITAIDLINSLTATP